MPTLSMFYGIIISMYFDDHNPPHFHASYQDDEAIFALDGTLLSGEMPSKQEALIKAWAQIHEDELRANWELAARKESVYKIDPLR